MPAGIPDDSSIEIEVTLPHEITLAGPLKVRCLGRIRRVESRGEGGAGVGAAIEHYEFLRGDKNAG